VSEERFSRIKNDDSFPARAIKFCLEEGGISPEELDGVAIASFEAPFDKILLRQSTWTVDDYLREQYFRWYPYFYGEQSEIKELLEIFPDKINLNFYPSEYWKENYLKGDQQLKFCKDREKIVADFLGIERDKVYRIEHHRCHAAYAYYSSSFREKEILVFTIDGYGDGLNATIGIYDRTGYYKRIYETGECNIGRIYRYMTLLLGMKPNEHEYKVMGLAPYGKEKYGKKALKVFRSTLYVDGIKFKWNIKPKDSYFWFKERLEGVRFDNIAWGLQTWTEELLTTWIKNAVNKFGIRSVVISGGVAMNIKAMGKIAMMPEVEELFVGGSGSDESMAISAGICLAEDLSEQWDAREVFPIENLYLGPRAKKEDELKAIKKLDRQRYRILEYPGSEFIANLLAKGKILARCSDRMEFGQRALGNRSILADPIDLRVKERINAAIKNRDFWMPFAPVIMDKFVSKYLKNHKNIQSPYMTIGFDTTTEGYDAMIAACHPADKTARPQILTKEMNPQLYEILEEFSNLTGRGALLNTSFNLHGYPIVNTPEDAIYVFENSDLDGLILNNYLILSSDCKK
jgi:carbamoyltransferase